jgi:hypothetical protein
LRAYGRWCVLFSVALCSALLPVMVSAGQSRTFPETGQTSSNAFYDFWLSHGQTETLGIPLSPVYTSKLGVVQIYERAVMEWHPENPRNSRVLLELLGVQLMSGVVAPGSTETLQASLGNAPPRSCGAGSNCETYPATNHTVSGAFRDYWYAHGGLETFGYPLTEEFSGYHLAEPDKAFPMQIFERARFEWHAEVNGGTVLLGLLGTPIYERLRDSINASNIVQVPDYDSDAPYLAP